MKTSKGKAYTYKLILLFMASMILKLLAPGGVGHDACVTCKRVINIAQVLNIFHVSK